MGPDQADDKNDNRGENPVVGDAQKNQQAQNEPQRKDPIGQGDLPGNSPDVRSDPLSDLHLTGIDRTGCP